MLTVKQVASKWGISTPRVHQFLRENRIEGAVKLGRDWLIPDDSPFPTYRRVWRGVTSPANA
jgi:excisionase family DNA binding protein